MRISLDFSDPTFVEDFSLALPMVIADCGFSPPDEAEVVISDNVATIERALESGAYGIHYCVCDDESAHRGELPRASRYRLVLDEGGAGASVLLGCVVDIARQTGNAIRTQD